MSGDRLAVRDRLLNFLVLSCEHGGNRVPAAYADLFAGRAAARALASHRGSDLGALALAESMARRLRAPLVASTVTRLLVDLNRSVGHRSLFSEFSRVLDREARQRLLERHYLPHRERVTEIVRSSIARNGRVVHVAVHSFTPRLGSKRRCADFGLLYDPARPLERSLSARWKDLLQSVDSHPRVRRNYPYRGAADGLTTHLRMCFSGGAYLGLELEVNEELLRNAAVETADAVVASLTGLGVSGGGRSGATMRKR